MELTSWLGAAFEGGGVAGLAHVGVIEVLNDMGILDKITHTSGSSAGSLIETLVSCRVPYETIKEIVMNLDYTSFQDSSWFVPFDVYKLVYNFGWNPGDALTKVYGDIMEKYVGNRSITFGQIREIYGTTVIITSTDVGLESTVYYTPDTHPDMPVIEAGRESSSIPGFYCPVVKDGHMYVDGGVLDNYPIQKLYDYLPKEKVFGVKLVSEDDNSNQVHKIPVNVTEYVMKIIKMLHHQASKVHIDDDDWKRTIKANVGSIKSTDFKLTNEQKLWLIEQGKIAAKKFFGV